MTAPSITKFFLTCTTLSKSQQLADAKVLAATPPSSGKWKRGQYSDYSPDQWLKSARYAIENGNSAAARHFSRALGKSLNESTARGMKTSYLKLKKLIGEMKTLPKSPRGLLLKLESFDAEVCDYITNLRKSGGVVNRRIVIAAAKGIIMAKDRKINKGSTTSCFSIF